MTQIKVYRAFREVRKSRNENSLSLLENFHARKGFPLPPQFRSREIRGRKTRTSGKTAREYPASTRNILSVADPRKHHPRGRSAKNTAKLESAEADPIRGGWTRRGWGGGGGGGRITRMFPSSGIVGTDSTKKQRPTSRPFLPGR